jgi:hypothetical protein
LENRINVLSVMMGAGIIDCVRIRVSAADVPSTRAMGALPVTEWSRDKLAENGKDGDYVRGLATGAAPVGPPILAVARDTKGPITVFDGMHRMAAWVAHINDGRGYSLEINFDELAEGVERARDAAAPLPAAAEPQSRPALTMDSAFDPRR